MRLLAYTDSNHPVCSWLHCPLTEWLDLQNVWIESKGPDDTLHMHRMIWICAFCTCSKALFRLIRFILTFHYYTIRIMIITFYSETERERERDAILTRIHNQCFEEKYKKHQSFYSENFQFLGVNLSIYLNVCVFVTKYFDTCLSKQLLKVAFGIQNTQENKIRLLSFIKYLHIQQCSLWVCLRPSPPRPHP